MSSTAPMRVGVFGATGRMGTTACAAIAADPELELVAAVAKRRAGETVAGIEVADDPAAMLEAGAQVAVDLSVIEAARANVAWCAEHGLHAVVGTTGFTDDDVAALRTAFTRSSCLIAPNFAIGAVLMMRFAELAAPFFETAEVIELHHDAKADAPSGTALMTARRMAAASPEWAPDPTRHEVVEGARGGAGPAGIRLHAVRLRGLVAHQEVLLGTTGQTLTIRHDSYDRASFMPGILLGIKRVADRPGVTVGLDGLLGV
jgi:4-hydroxy-tetrahydrodipicolinate reductase